MDDIRYHSTYLVLPKEHLQGILARPYQTHIRTFGVQERAGR